MNVILPKLEYTAEVWEGNAKFVKQLETAQMTAAAKKKNQDAQVRLLRGTIVNRTYGKRRNLSIYLLLLTVFGPIYYGPPVIVIQHQEQNWECTQLRQTDRQES